MQTLLICLAIIACIFVASGEKGDAMRYTSTAEQNDVEQKSDEVTAAGELDSGLPIERKRGSRHSLPLNEISLCALNNHFGVDDQYRSGRMSPTDLARLFEVGEDLGFRRGLFVTLSKNGSTRACWGSVNPNHEDLVQATIYTTVDALTREYRHSPIRRSELSQIKAQVTVVDEIIPIYSVAEVNPFMEGLMVRAGGRGAVVLPGEASDSYHQMVMCKLKAGIASGQQCQLYKLRVQVYK